MGHEHTLSCLEEIGGKLTCKETDEKTSTQTPSSKAKKRGIGPGTVQNFLMVLSSKITQQDMRYERADSKRGIPINIYRLGHWLGALERVRDRVKDYEGRSDATSLDSLKRAMNREFTTGFTPVMNVEKQIGAWLATGKEPSFIG